MSKIIVEQKELFKIIGKLEEACNAFDGFLNVLDGCMLDDDFSIVEDILTPIEDSQMILKGLSECLVE